MISDTFKSRLSTNLKSLLVTMPTNLLLSTIGTPEILYFFVIILISAIDIVGEAVTGSFTIPLSYFLTNLICLACSSIDIFLCIIPIPPSPASVIAIWDSVTVSIAADNIGVCSWIFLVKLVLKITSVGRISEY